ncbi:hypothetical protein ISS07_03780 [Candidatus Woesearchaeota archaeon]|nr:hypothetical protein [Candidatus Woesearchaeota archaeon]
MGNTVLTTGADDLYKLVRSRKKISVEEAAKRLNIPDKTVHSLVDFFIEEKIFGIEYKFTTPYIYLSHEKTKKSSSSEGNFSKNLITKEQFFEKAKAKDISFDKIGKLWEKYLNENMSYIKDEFHTKARLRNISSQQMNNLWEKYLTYLR